MSTESNRTGCSDKLTGGGLNLRYAYTADDERILEFDATAFQSVWRLRDLGGQVIREFRQNTATVTNLRWKTSRRSGCRRFPRRHVGRLGGRGRVD